MRRITYSKHAYNRAIERGAAKTKSEAYYLMNELVLAISNPELAKGFIERKRVKSNRNSDVIKFKSPYGTFYAICQNRGIVTIYSREEYKSLVNCRK